MFCVYIVDSTRILFFHFEGNFL